MGINSNESNIFNILMLVVVALLAISMPARTITPICSMTPYTLLPQDSLRESRDAYRGGQIIRRQRQRHCGALSGRSVIYPSEGQAALIVPREDLPNGQSLKCRTSLCNSSAFPLSCAAAAAECRPLSTSAGPPG